MPTEHDPFAPHDVIPSRPAAKTSSRSRKPKAEDAQPTKGEQMVVKATAAKKAPARKTTTKKTAAKRTAGKKRS